jgi:uncharacterized membrane protein
MKKWLIGLLAVALLGGCGALYDIDYHWDVDPDWLEQQVGYPVLGYTTWTPFTCDIYIAPAEMFSSDECFDAVIEHEERHCIDGNFHPNTPEGSLVKECVDLQQKGVDNF